MGWWSLGPEDEETSIEMPPSLPVRSRARGGAGRVPGRKVTDQISSPSDTTKKTRSRSPRKSKRSKSPKKKRTRVVGGPQQEVELNLFASIGRMVTGNNTTRHASDLSTLGTAKYPGQNGIVIQASNNANEALRRANEMANAMAWLTNPIAMTAKEAPSSDLFADSEHWWEAEDSSSTTMEASSLLLKPEEMPDLVALLKLGQVSQCDISTVPIDNEASKKRKAKGKVLPAETKAKDLQRSVEWLKNNCTNYVHEHLEENTAEEPFQTVDAGFGQWKLKRTPSLNWEPLNVAEDRKHAQRLAKKLKYLLDQFLNDAFDSAGSSHDGITLKQLKNLFANWKFQEGDGTKELEEALNWWNLHACNYDPLTATNEETDKILKYKRILALLGLKEDEVWDKRGKEMQELLSLWRTCAKKSLQDLDDLSVEKLKTIEDVLVQIKRIELTHSDMKYMAKEMDKTLTWYMDRGHKITDLSKSSKSYRSTFQKAQSVLSLWVKTVEPDQRVMDVVELFKSLEQNSDCSEIVEKYNGEMANRFQKLQEAMMNWKGSGRSSVSPKDSMDVCNTIENVLDWWVANGEYFDVESACAEEVDMAQVARSMLHFWTPTENGTQSTFDLSRLALEEINDNLIRYRTVFEDPEQELGDLTTKIVTTKSRKSNQPATTWMRQKDIATDVTDSPESPDIGQRSSLEFNGVVHRALLSEEEKRAEDMSSALDWLRKNDTELDVDDDMSVALSIATFKKIDLLMPKMGDSASPTTMEGALEWLRSTRTTPVDDDTVSSFKKIDDVLTRSGAFDTIKEGGFVGALEWLRQRHVKKEAASDLGRESTSCEADLEHVEIICANPNFDDVKRAEQMRSALDWLRDTNAEEDISVGSNNSDDSPETMPVWKSAGIKTKDSSFRTWGNKPHRNQMSTIEWTRFMDSPSETREEELQLNRACNISCIPRDDSPTGVDEDDLFWTMHVNRLIPGVPNERVLSQDHGLLNFIPHSPEYSQALENSPLDWVRQPETPSEMIEVPFEIKDENLIGSIPKDGPPQETDDPEINWLRPLNYSVPGVCNEEHSFDKLGMLKSLIPRTSQDDGVSDGDSSIEWIHYYEVPTCSNEDLLTFDRVGDIRSIPRDGLPKSKEDSETEWTRHPNKGTACDVIQGNKLRQLNLVLASRDWNLEGSEEDLQWSRHPNEKVRGFTDEALHLSRPGDVQSIPLRGEKKPEGDSEVAWTCHPNRGIACGVIQGDRKGQLNLVPTSLDSDYEGSKDNLCWSRYPNKKVAGVPVEEPLHLSRPGDVRSIPRHGNEKAECAYELMFARQVPKDDRCEAVAAQPFERPTPPTRKSCSKSSEVDDDGKETPWVLPLFPGNSPNEEEDVFDRPAEVRSLPRTGKPEASEDPEFRWGQSGTEFVPVASEDGDAFITHDRVPEGDSANSCEWSQQPSVLISTPWEENSCRPGCIQSIPCAGKPQDKAHRALGWNRNPALNKQGVRSDGNVFDRPSDLKSIPRTGRLHDQNYPEVFWDRNNSVSVPEEQFDQKTTFDLPRDLRSIPRDGHPHDVMYLEMTWGRNTGPKQRRFPEDKTIFDTPGNLRSIPRDGTPKGLDHFDFEWERQPPFEDVCRFPETKHVFDRPGDLKSIPRDGQSKEPDETDVRWRRHFSHKSVTIIPAEEDLLNRPVYSREIPRDGMGPVQEQVYRFEEEPDYEWSGYCSDQLLVVEADFDWSSDKSQEKYAWMIAKPDKTLRNLESRYDWSDARPFERPENMLETLSIRSPEDEQLSEHHAVQDDLTEYSELRQHKPKPVTGVPCAAWAMLALGAAAGGAMTSGTAPAGTAVASRFANSNGVGSSTDMIYPTPGSLPSCSTDANCQIVMDGLSPVLPPNVLGLFDLPGTCQTKARDWLRTGKDILEFKAERIRQRYAMSVFFCEMDGGDWVQGDSWLSDLHECDWYNKIGLDPCNRHEQMEMLRVTDNGLAGTLPVEMFILSNLYEFTLANNLISGAIPQLFDKFGELDTLVIPFNQFEGSLPYQIWEYPDLVYLDVAYNGFSGTIPTDIDTRMPNLQVAFLENNKLSGPIPDTLGNLQKLQRLHLDDNKFTGKVPSALGQPPRLSELLLHDNLLTGQVPKELGDLKRLQLLTLHYNSFEEQTMDEHICSLVYIEQLVLATVDKAIIDCGCCSSGEESFV